MLKPISFDKSQITAEAQVEAQARATAAMDTAKRTFQALHGIYGNVFFSRYQTGDLIVEGKDEGKDKGVLGAMLHWAYDLRDFDEETVKAALDRAKARYIEFPPTLPQFSELCRALRPRGVLGDKDAVVKIGMSQELRSQYARQAREINARHAAAAVASRIGYREIEPGLTGLKRAIAGAVAEAGGDEVAELLRLDRLFSSQPLTLAPREDAHE